MSGDAQELTRAAYERLKTELDELSNAGRVDIAQQIEAARALGDLSENGDYHAAKEEQGKMEARIRQLRSVLRDAVVVDGRPSSDTVTVGTVVAVRFDGDDEPERYLVGSIEERHADLEVVSPGSPLGQALMGAAPGEKRSYEVNGTTLAVAVLAIEA